MNLIQLLFRHLGEHDKLLRALYQQGKVLMAQNELILRNQEKIMAGQESIDAATAALTSMEADEASKVAELISDFGALTQLIQDLKNQGVNTDALDAALAKAQATAAGLDPAVAQITSLAQPAPPAPPAQ